MSGTERTATLTRELDQPSLELDILVVLANTFVFAGEFEIGVDMYREALQLSRHTGNLEREAMVMANLAATAHANASTGRVDQMREAIELYREAFRLQEEIGASGALMTLGNLAQALVEVGESEAAAEHAIQVLRASSTGRLASERALAVVVHAQLAFDRGDRERGLDLLGAVARDQRSSDFVLHGELERVLSVHGIDRDSAMDRIGRGGELDLDTLIEELLNDDQD